MTPVVRGDMSGGGVDPGMSCVMCMLIVEYIIHSDIPNYTKLAFNNLKMFQNDSFSTNQTGDDWLLNLSLFPRLLCRQTAVSWLR